MSDKNDSTGTPPAAQETSNALQALRDAIAAPVDPNDLGRLAQMHTWCQTLAESGASGSETGGADAVSTLAATLATLLEALILAEAARPDQGLALIPEVVTAMQAAGEGQPVDWKELLGRMRAALGGDADAEPSTECTASPAEAPPPASAPPAPSASEGGSEGGDEPYVSEPLTVDLSEKEHLLGFVDESSEHMDTIETALLEVEQNPSDTNKLNELFRPFHTIKGIAGFLNLRDINRLTHEVETILDMGRKSELRITPEIIDLIFAAIDVLKDQIAELQSYLANPEGDTVPQPEVADIISQLRTAAAARPTASGAKRQRIGEILAADREEDIQAALDLQAQAPEPPKLGDILVDMGAVSRNQVQQALVKQTARKTATVDQSIRVDTGKLDTLVDAVGELVIAQTMVNLNSIVHTDEKLSRLVSQVTKIVRDVQETAMGMRMVPIGHTFQKMRRLVRDVARKAGKQVELTITGEETELDKNVIQQISDPLVHMVRNAVDHGVEPPDARRQAGKPETGRVTLNAYHQGDSIAIEIGDDGRGLDRDKLIAKGIERGLTSADEQLTDQQVFAMILAPGFSTAEEVTDISGRGVGMDVVKRNIDQLRGKIEIASEKGRGTKMTIRLPLTLAIIDGMLVRVGSERLIIPTTLIEQSLRPEPHHITTVQHRGEMVRVRGELLPLIQLGALFGYGPPVDPSGALVVITHCEARKLALVVDELIDQQQVVIKTLGDRFKQVQGVSGAAILGDGRVGLILEPAGLLALHTSTQLPQRDQGRCCAAPGEAPDGIEPALSDPEQAGSVETVVASLPELAVTSE